MQGYIDGSYDYRQMYDVKDLQGKLPIPRFNAGTLLGALSEIECAQPFFELLKTIPLSGLFNDPQADFTLFVPVTLDQQFENASSFELTQLVKMHTLEHALAYSYLRSVGIMTLRTLLNGYKIFLNNIGTETPVINGVASVIGWETVGNAILVFLDRPIPKCECPMLP